MAIAAANLCSLTLRPPDEATLTDVVLQVWGIPWSDAEFVAKASLAGHPCFLESTLPPALSSAIDRFHKSSPAERSKKRVAVLRKWLARANELSVKEKAMHEAMHPCVKKMLDGKRLLVLEEMLREAQYPDMGVVKEFREGSALVGEAPRTGLWPQKLSPASTTESELRESAARERAAVQSRTTDGQLDRQVWGATIKEVGLGYLDGPMELSDVPNDWLLSPRFGIMQGSKMRCIDDFSRSGECLFPNT